MRPKGMVRVKLRLSAKVDCRYCPIRITQSPPAPDLISKGSHGKVTCDISRATIV
jgi:hypothetical protein